MQAVSKLLHPEIDYSLVDLGMIKDVGIEKRQVIVTINLPFPEVPVRDDLAQMVKDAVASEDGSVVVEADFATMDEQEREEFMKKAREKWKS